MFRWLMAAFSVKAVGYMIINWPLDGMAMTICLLVIGITIITWVIHNYTKDIEVIEDLKDEKGGDRLTK